MLSERTPLRASGSPAFCVVNPEAAPTTPPCIQITMDDVEVLGALGETRTQRNAHTAQHRTTTKCTFIANLCTKSVLA